MKYIKVLIVVAMLTLSIQFAKAGTPAVIAAPLASVMQIRLPPPPPRPPLPFGHRRYHRRYHRRHRGLHINLHLPPPPPPPPRP